MVMRTLSYFQHAFGHPKWLQPLLGKRKKLLNQERAKGLSVKTPLAWLALCAAPLLAQAQDNCTFPNSNDDYILGTADGTATSTGACQMTNVTGMRSVTAQFALDGVCGTSHGVATLTPP